MKLTTQRIQEMQLEVEALLQRQKETSYRLGELQAKLSDPETAEVDQQVDLVMSCLEAVEAAQRKINKDQEESNSYLGGSCWQTPWRLTEEEKRQIVENVLLRAERCRDV